MIAKTDKPMELLSRKRAESDTPDAIRQAGDLPAVLYGKETDNTPLVISAEDFAKLFKEAGETTIIDLKIDGEKEPRAVLVKDIQYDPVSDQQLHVDFYQIKVGEKLRATVELRFEGEAPAVKEFGGVLITNKDEIEVECFPRDLPRDIEVDLSGLNEIDDSITVKDLKIPSGVEVLDEPDESIVVVAPPREEEEEPEVSEEEAVASVEATAEKGEGEEGEESTGEKDKAGEQEQAGGDGKKE